MNKEEAIERVKDKALYYFGGKDIEINTAIGIINQIDELQKPKVPQVAIEFYERYKDDALDLGGWFSDFYSKEAIEDFPRMEELTEWLHGNDNETNRQREYALATLVTFGPDAVEVVEEPLGVLLVDIPGNRYWKFNYLCRDEGVGLYVGVCDKTTTLVEDAHKVTESEAAAKEKYPNFKWVSLEELENE